MCDLKARHDASVDLELAGKACIVTGASRGIGLATAKLLTAEGADVLLTARSADTLTAAAAQCPGPGRAETLVADVIDPDAAVALVAACAERLGPADVLVNNAGSTEAKTIEALGDADWQYQWELNVMGPMRLMKAVAPVMAERGGGRIVNVSSSSGKRPSLNNAAYSVAKAAELSLSRAFAQEYAASNVLINAIAPGPISSGLWLDEGGLADQHAAALGISREELLEAQGAKVPLGRFGTEEEVARVIVALSSSIAANVTGAAWSADGGAVSVII